MSKREVIYKNGGSGAIYCLGWIGSLIYFIGSAGSFWMGVQGVLKSFVWPAILVYQLFEYLAMVL